MQNQNQPFNQADPFSSSSASVSVADSPLEARLAFVRKTYVLFLAGILCCLLAGVATLRVPALYHASASLNFIFAILLMVGLCVGAQAVSRIEGINYAALFGFTAFMGWLFTPMLAGYEAMLPGILTQASALTAITFGALTAYAFVSKKDFSFLSGILFVGLVGLVLGGFANAFIFHSPLTSYIMAWFTLLIFSGYVLYDTSNIMRRYDTGSYCSAALSLFLDFFNMFIAILRILSGSRR
jgi:modulator of FtsH protease